MVTQPATQFSVQRKDQAFPLWFYVLTGMLIISNLFVFGILTLLDPLGTFMQSDETAIFPIEFFAVRHIALSVPLLHGLLIRNVTVLRTMYTIFVVISVLDISLLIYCAYYIPLIGDLPLLTTAVLALGLFFTPMVLGLRYLRNFS